MSINLDEGVRRVSQIGDYLRERIETANECMILSESFFRIQGDQKVFLQESIKGHKIWSESKDYWLQVIICKHSISDSSRFDPVLTL